MKGNHTNHKKKWLTIEEFNDFKKELFDNHLKHIKKDIKFNRRLLIGILIATVVLPTAFMICIVQILG